MKNQNTNHTTGEAMRDTRAHQTPTRPTRYEPKAPDHDPQPTAYRLTPAAGPTDFLAMAFYPGMEAGEPQPEIDVLYHHELIAC